jgi:Uma2 family endonuclease
MSVAADNWFQKHRITVDEYYRMAEVGLLAPGARVELIEGEVFDMAPIGISHAYVVDALNQLLFRAVGDRAVVAVQRPLRLDVRSEPQPDLALLRAPLNRYAKRHPAAQDVLLLIEVCDTSLRYDREIKVPLYARHAIPEVWLIDVATRQVHCLRQPTGERYKETTTVERGAIAPMALPDTHLDIAELMAGLST